MDKATIGQMLRRLTETDGPSGDEGRVTALIRELIGAFADELHTDALGNLMTLRHGAGNPAGRIMLAAHMDEIGLTVTKVNRGFLHVGAVGGITARSLLGQEVTVYPSGPGAEAHPNGLPGYIGSKPPHVLTPDERRQVAPLTDLRVDLGLAPAALAAGLVRVGDRVAVRGPYTELLAGRIAAKALDNRASVAALIATLGYLAGRQHPFDVIAVTTVQEEVGLRGAIASAFGVAPDLAIAIDVTFGETPGEDNGQTVAMNRGPAIGWGPNLHPGVVKRLRETADAWEIPYVTEPLPGHSGTDAWAIQVAREGIPTGLASIPIRYMHSAVELALLADIDRTARLLATFIGQLDAAFLQTLAEEV
jgi:endoglucanase